MFLFSKITQTFLLPNFCLYNKVNSFKLNIKETGVWVWVMTHGYVAGGERGTVSASREIFSCTRPARPAKAGKYYLVPGRLDQPRQENIILYQAV